MLRVKPLSQVTLADIHAADSVLVYYPQTAWRLYSNKDVFAIITHPENIDDDLDELLAVVLPRTVSADEPVSSAARDSSDTWLDMLAD